MDNILDDLINREQKLLDELSASPVVEITGLVNISGVGASKVGKQTLWSMTFNFDVWRIGNGEMEKHLIIRRKVTDRELKKYQKKIKADSIIKIRGRVLKDNIFNNAQALIEKHLKSNIDDIEIKNYLMEIRKPVIYEDDLLGTFNYDRRLKWFKNSILWVNKKIDVSLSIEKMEDLDSVIKTLHILYNDQTNWNNKVVDYATSDLLPLKNDCWLEEDEVEITEEQFKERMELESITVFNDGSFEFWHSDGDLFWGHSIVIYGNIIDGPTDADIPG